MNTTDTSIKSAVDKLAELMRNSPDDLRQDLKSLIDDLEKIPAAGLADEQVKVWVKQVRELTYDFEDWQLLSESESSWALQISEFKDLIQNARERYARYDLLNKALATDARLVDAGRSEVGEYASSSNAEVTSDDPPLLLGEKAVLVGVDGPKKELIRNHLNKQKKMLTVVFILGVGGLGKTTFAKEIYQDLRAEFDCQASVFLGQIPSMKVILLDILNQLRDQKDVAPTDGRDTGEREVIAQLREFLGNKRYLILVDDIQSAWAWKVINCAFPENDCGSRIFVTTRSKDVAELCSLCPGDVVYKMEPLSLDNSQELLGNIIAIPENKRPADFEEVTDRVLKTCGGIPLAIVVTAGLLSWNWSVHGKYHFPLLDQTYSTSELMRKVLDISFDDLLSLHVKYCFLLLSSFPVNYTINKDHLIRRWVTEGLVKEENGNGLWETGESYFNELICRRLIEPVFDYNDDQPVGCTVHDVVYDFITSLAREYNFVTAAADLVRGPFPCDTIRRYSVHYSEQNDEADTLVSSTMHLSRVRCLTVFGEGRVPYDRLSAFKLLRVLDLKDTKFRGSLSLTFHGCLTLLQYLALGRQMTAGSCPINLVPGFYKHLETLDVSGIQRACFSDSIYRLPKLVAIIGDIVELPWSDEPKGMLNWEEVATVNIKTQAEYAMVELLFKSKRLRKLGVGLASYFKSEREKANHFFIGLRECKAQCLLLDCDYMPEGWAPSPSLRRFVLKRFISRVPDTWPSSLVNLTNLDIQIFEVGVQDISYIGELPKLMFLKLCSEGYDPKNRLLVSRGLFKCLKVAWFQCPDGGMGLQFGNRNTMPELRSNTMPELRRLRLDFNERKTRDLYGGSFDFGLEFPSRLIEVHVAINCKGSTHGDVSDAERAIEDQLLRHSNKPRFQFRRVEGKPVDNAVGASSGEGSRSKQIIPQPPKRRKKPNLFLSCARWT